MKQAIVARADLGMGEGKLAAQVAHASLSAFQDAPTKARKDWQGEGQTKIVRDAGRTQLEPGTVTALAVGPAEDDAVDAVTGDLSLY